MFSMRPRTPLHPKRFLSRVYPLIICSPRFPHPFLARCCWFKCRPNIPSDVEDGKSAAPERVCARTSSAEHSQDNKQLPAVSQNPDPRFPDSQISRFPDFQISRFFTKESCNMHIKNPKFSGGASRRRIKWAQKK